MELMDDNGVDGVYDALGTRIRVGHFIVYATSKGRGGPMLRLGMVRAIDANSANTLRIYTEKGGKASLTYTSRIITIEDARVPAATFALLDPLRHRAIE